MNGQFGFESLTNIHKGIPGTAPKIYSASTTENLASLITFGRMNLMAASGQTYTNDYFFINYNDVETDGVITNTPGLFQVVFSSPNYSLVDVLGTGDNVLNYTGTLVVNHLVKVSSATGILTDAGIVAPYAKIQSTPYAGGGTTLAIPITGMVVGDLVDATLTASTNVVAFKIVAAAGQANVTFASDPGTGTILTVTATHIA